MIHLSIPLKTLKTVPVLTSCAIKTITVQRDAETHTPVSDVCPLCGDQFS